MHPQAAEVWVSLRLLFPEFGCRSRGSSSPDSPASTSKDSRHASDSPPSVSVDAGYGLVLGVDPWVSPKVLGSSPSVFDHGVNGPSSATEVASGKGPSSEFSFELALEVLTGMDSSPRTTQKEVVVAPPSATVPTSFVHASSLFSGVSSQAVTYATIDFVCLGLTGWA